MVMFDFLSGIWAFGQGLYHHPKAGQHRTRWAKRMNKIRPSAIREKYPGKRLKGNEPIQELMTKLERVSWHQCDGEMQKKKAWRVWSGHDVILRFLCQDSRQLPRSSKYA